MVENAFHFEESLQGLARANRYFSALAFPNVIRFFPQAKCSSNHSGAHGLGSLPRGSQVFTWLRDPIDAAFSGLHFLMQELSFSDEPEKQDLHAKLKEVVSTSSSPYDAYMKAVQLTQASADVFFQGIQPLIRCLSPRGRQSVDPPSADFAIKTLQQLFFIGLVEEQETSIKMLARFLPLRVTREPLRANKTLDRPRSISHFPNEQLEELRELFSADYELYREARRIWELQRQALEEEGWLEQSVFWINQRSLSRIYRGDKPSLEGCWTASEPVFADRLADKEFMLSPDKTNPVIWRWTSPGDSASVSLPIEARLGSRIVIEIFHITPIASLRSLKVSIDGVQAALRYLGRKESCYRYEVLLQPLQSQTLGIDLTIAAEKPFIEPQGARSLGIALSAIRWQPL